MSERIGTVIKRLEETIVDIKAEIRELTRVPAESCSDDYLDQIAKLTSIGIDLSHARSGLLRYTEINDEV